MTPILAGVSEPSVAQLRRRLDSLTIRDEAHLGRRLKNLRGPTPQKLQQLADQIADAEYLTAIGRRLERLSHSIEADRERMQRVQAVQEAYDELTHALPPARRTAADVREITWQIEELRVSLWAQQLGTPRPVSEQRIYRAIDAVRDV